MSREDFFVLMDEGVPGALMVEAADEGLDGAALLAAEVVPDAPVEFRRCQGSRVCDVVVSTDAVLLFGDRLVDLLRERRFTGWRTFPVTVRARDGSPIEGLQGVQFPGRAGPLRDDLSERVTIPPPVPQGSAVRGRRGWFFEEATWDGSDLFVPEGTTAIFARPAVVEALAGAGTTNLEWVRAAEVTLPGS